MDHNDQKDNAQNCRFLVYNKCQRNRIAKISHAKNNALNIKSRCKHCTQFSLLYTWTNNLSAHLYFQTFENVCNLKKNKQRIIVIANIFHYTFVYKVLLRSKNTTFHLRNYYYINLILSTLLRILILIHSFSLRVISMLTIPNICKQVRFCLHYKNNPLKRVMYFLSNECHLHSPHKTSKKAFYCSYLHLSLNHLKYYLWWKVS